MGLGVGLFLLETVNLISQCSGRNRKSNSVGAALSISCLAAQVDKCTVELIKSILDALMLFIYFIFFYFVFFSSFLFSSFIIHVMMFNVQ